MKDWMILPALAFVLCIIASGFYSWGRHDGKMAGINLVEQAIEDSLRTGRRFGFHDGRVGILVTKRSDGSKAYKAKLIAEANAVVHE